MAYIGYSEYLAFNCTEISEEDFERLVGRSEAYIDNLTRNFYQFNDLESDNEFRKNKFKKAIGLQIEYMYSSGASNNYEINTPQTWSIGRTNVSEASRYSHNGKNEEPSIISDDAILALSGTGLLYRGLGGIH